MPSLYSDDRNRQSQGRSTTPPTASDTMRAIVQFRYGTDPSSVLELADVARPAIGEDEVLVRVAAASVDMGSGQEDAQSAWFAILDGLGSGRFRRGHRRALRMPPVD